MSCQGVRSARIVEQPAHGRVTDVATVSYGFGFTLTADAEAPRADHALFELHGSERTVKLRVEIEVIPAVGEQPARLQR